MTAVRAGRGRLAAALLALLAACAANADGAHHTLWAVQGRHNTVYLLGSVHVLKPQQSALPAEAQAAYARAHTIVMEIALDQALAPEDLQAAMLAQGMLPEGQSLQASLGEALYRRLAERAPGLGLDLAQLQHFQPWIIALLLQQAQLTRSGYAAGAGVDLQLASQAQTDHKTIIGLETLAQQFALFAQLTPAQQRQFLAQTLAEVDAVDDEAAGIVAAWRAGDTRQLDAVLQKSRRESPQLFDAMTTQRNRRWLPRIIELLNGDEDCLVIVGALHLVGRDGLVQLLQRRGFHPVQQ
jgi:uncharacterized protein YbaP (TraB family)